jgi:hypothetical protein
MAYTNGLTGVLLIALAFVIGVLVGNGSRAALEKVLRKHHGERRYWVGYSDGIIEGESNEVKLLTPSAEPAPYDWQFDEWDDEMTEFLEWGAEG